MPATIAIVIPLPVFVYGIYSYPSYETFAQIYYLILFYTIKAAYPEICT